MKEIGKKLRARREKLNLSYDDISAITKMPVPHIKAIENGDLDYFKNDLSYVRFYVRSYCKAIDVPYENFREDVLDSIDDYTNTLTLKAIKEYENIETHVHDKVVAQKNDAVVQLANEGKGPKVAKKDRVSISQNAQSSSRFRKAKLDIPFLSLIIVAIIVFVLLVYVGVSMVFNKDSDDTPKEDSIVEKEPTPTPEKEPVEEEKPVEEKSTVKVEKQANSTYMYQVSGLKKEENLKIEIAFPSVNGFNLWKNGATVPNAQGQYSSEKGYTLETTWAANDEYTLNIWDYKGITVTINGQKLELKENDGIVQDGVRYFTFKVLGE